MVATMNIYTITFLVFMCNFNVNAGISWFEVAVTLLGVTKDLFEIAYSVNDEADFLETSDDKWQRHVDKTLEELSFRTVAIQEKLDNIGDDVGFIKTKLNNLESLVPLVIKQEKIETVQEGINHFYNRIKKYSNNPSGYENWTLINSANTILSIEDSSVSNLLNSMNKQFTGTKFLSLVKQNHQPGGNTFCQLQTSLQQLYIELVFGAMLTNFRGYLSMQYAFTIKKMYKQGMFAKEMIDAKDDFMNYNKKLLSILDVSLKRASLELWKCNPDEHIRDETFIELRNFLHGFLINEENLNRENSCDSECPSYSYTKKLYSSGNPFFKEQIHCPKIINCKPISNGVRVCMDKMAKSNRRYKFLELDRGKTFGRKGNCPGKTIQSTYWRKFPFFPKCDYCWCLCDEGPKVFSHRYINLRSATSNIKANKVVIGIRFVENNQIIHLQVQEGKLLQYGKIDPDSIRWVPVENYRVTDDFIFDRSGYHTLDEGQDYHVLSWENRAVDLADIKVDNGSVVTGVRFRRLGSRLHLEVQATRFDFTTGVLKSKITYFVHDPDIELKHTPSKELNLVRPDVPTLVTPTGIYDIITTNKTVQFVVTDFEKDAGQTTVPFFDAQPLESATPVPLTGIGIFHRGQRGSGGFIAPRIFTYNFEGHHRGLREKMEKMYEDERKKH